VSTGPTSIDTDTTVEVAGRARSPTETRGT
jgi:hypothetical protein